MRLAIVGSRDFPNLELVELLIEQLPLDTIIITGGARGVDKTAETAARKRGMDVVVYPADWLRYGRSAGYRRNQDIVDSCDSLIAFWDGKSRGTQHSITLAQKQGKPVKVIVPN